jgi:DNA helicase HerA-like ATPase
VARQYIVDPQIAGDVHVGTDGDQTQVFLGHLSETGPLRRVYFGGSKEFVTLIVGKRGSGKSHTLGALLEGLATKEDSTSISKHTHRRAVLLLDPMGNFWTTAHKVSAQGKPKVRAQFASLEGWRCGPEDVDVTVWLPAGFKLDTDPATIKEFSIRVADLDAADLADLIGLNLVKDAQGAILAEAYDAVRHEGWRDAGGQKHEPGEVTFDRLLAYVEHIRQFGGGDHHASAVKALARSLRALQRRDVFCREGTPLNELLVAGSLSVLMLPLRVGNDLRRVITRLLIRRTLREREQASQIRQRLDVESLDPADAAALEDRLSRMVPRSVIAIDEAQELLGDEGREARQALEDFCLLGRNYGLSLLLATQRPMASAISAKVRSQVDLHLIHRLLTQDDIDVCRSNLLGVLPREIRDGTRDLDFSQLVRSLDRGQAVVSASHAVADEPVSRIFLTQVRPRVTVHGGEVE